MTKRTIFRAKYRTYLLGYIDFEQVKIKQTQNLGNKIIQYCKLIIKKYILLNKNYKSL